MGLGYKFQFLIGRLETSGAGVKAPHTIMFQFLIGRLETPKPRRITWDKFSFNSS